MTSPASSLTPQQKIAVELRGTSIHLSSGAGCGKTHVLTERYLSHLKNDGAEVGQIVAITFTERAARQMRERIRNAFIAERERSSPEFQPRWDTHLENLEYAPISTIHAFCGNLLRQYATEVDLDPQFDILNEVLSLNVRWATIREELQSLLLNLDEAGHSLRELTKLVGWYRVQTTLLRLISQYDPDTWSRFLSQDEATYRTAMESAKRKILGEYITYLRSGDATLGRHLGVMLTTRYKDDSLPDKIEDILLRLDRLPQESNLAQAIADLLEQTKGPGALKPFVVDSDDYQPLSKALQNFRSTLKNRLDAFLEDEPNNGQDFHVAQHFIRVATELTLAYRRRKREKSLVDFDDLLILARRLVADNPSVQRTLADKYSFVLLDELQDTDPTQMELIELLCGAGLKFGKLFAVGDAKQSIYRFRGADVRLFDKLRSDLPVEGRLDLSRNFRSQRGILDFVNALCKPAFPGYVPLEAHHAHFAKESAVEFLWTFPAEIDTSDFDDEEGAKKESVDDVRRREARFLANWISELIESRQKRVWDSRKKAFRAAEAKDITILFRSMSNVAIYEEALRENGIDYYLIGGRAFFAQQEIQDILNVLRVIENASDAIALAGVLRSPMGGLNDESLLLLSFGKGDLWDCLQGDSLPDLPLEQTEAIHRIRKWLGEWRAIKDRVGIAELLQKIIDDTGYDAALQFEFLGDRKLANLWKLIDLARTFDESGLFSLADFIERLAELVARQPKEEQAATLPENADVVKLMTIHQSKGLEFSVVVLADFNGKSGGNPEGNARWHENFGCVVNPPSDEDPPPYSGISWKLASVADQIADWQEELRVLYVACTRAEDILVLSGGFTKSSDATDPHAFLARIAPGSWTMQLGGRFNLRTGEFLGGESEALEHPIAVSIGLGDRPALPKPKEPTGKSVTPISMANYHTKPDCNAPVEIDLNSFWGISASARGTTLILSYPRSCEQFGYEIPNDQTLLTCTIDIETSDPNSLKIPDYAVVQLDELSRLELTCFCLLAWYGEVEKASGGTLRIAEVDYRFDRAIFGEFLAKIRSKWFED